MLDYFKASETVMQFSLGWFAKPVLVDGRYPEVCRYSEKLYLGIKMILNTERRCCWLKTDSPFGINR